MPYFRHRRAHIVVNTNKWFSAVSDYALQLSLHLADMRDAVLCLSHEESPLQEKWRSRGVPTAILPLLGAGAWGWITAWRSLPHVLSGCLVSLRSSVPLDVPEPGRLVDSSVDDFAMEGIVWVFEGREHTLCALHRLLHPRAWKGWKLVRVRGQAAPVRKGLMNRNAYTRGIDVLVCAADVVARRILFQASLPRRITFPYCSRFSRDNQAELESAAHSAPQPLPFVADAPDIDPRVPLFLVVGRYDPVKGHASLLEALTRMFRNDASLPATWPHSPSPTERLTPDAPLQLVFVGRSENVHAHDLVQHACELWGGTPSGHGSRQCVSAFDGRLRLHVFDERVEGVASLMARAHYGVIPSLGSEVICRVAVEFLQAGTPLISSTAGALAEVIPSACGRFFVPGETDSCARAIEGALSTLLDAPSTHAALREACRVAGESLYAASNYERLIEEVVRLCEPVAHVRPTRYGREGGSA